MATRNDFSGYADNQYSQSDSGSNDFEDSWGDMGGSNQGSQNGFGDSMQSEGWGSSQSPSVWETQQTGQQTDTWGQENQQQSDSWDLNQGQQSQTDSWDLSQGQQQTSSWDDMVSQPTSAQASRDAEWASMQQGGNTQQQNFNQGVEIPQMSDAPDVGNPLRFKEPVRFNFSPKMVGLFVGGGILLIALIMYMFSGIKVKPKNQQVQGGGQVQQTQGVQQQVQQQPSQAMSANGGVELIFVPDSTAMNYSGEIFEANGTVTGKKKYVQGSQVVYCIEITLAFGSTSETVNFYCNYSTFTAVGAGDVVVVKYQQVSDGYISINEVVK